MKLESGSTSSPFDDLVVNTTTLSNFTGFDNSFNYDLVVRVTLALCLTAILVALFFVLLLVFYAKYREYGKSVPVEVITKDPACNAHPSCALLTNGYQRRVVIPDEEPQEPSGLEQPEASATDTQEPSVSEFTHQSSIDEFVRDELL
jgi:hypothetical protein